jgi:flagellar motor component MotA
MTTRALFSINDDIMAMFRTVVPSSERSKTVEKLMREEIARREQAREQRMAQLAAMVETEPEFADLRAVSDDVDAVAGESVE